MRKEFKFPPVPDVPETSKSWTGRDLGGRVSSSMPNPQFGRDRKENFVIEKQLKNYCGLPIHAFNPSAYALAYQSRKPILIETKDDNSTINGGNEGSHSEYDFEKAKHTDVLDDSKNKSITSNNNQAQRKVSKALLTMASLPNMVVHFVNKGGVDAIVKLIDSSEDIEVLVTCILSLIKTARVLEYARNFINRDILSSVNILLEHKESEYLMLLCSNFLANLSLHIGLEEQMVLAGAIPHIQYLFTNTDNIDTLSYALVVLSNLAPFLVDTDAEIVVRIFLQIPKRFDIYHNQTTALLMMQVLVNLSRVSHFCSQLCEEGILPLLLHTMDAHPNGIIITKCTECFLNFSAVRKNRREIASCGVANQLDKIFELDSAVRTNSLLMIGNLLNSGFFHDKVGKEEIISNLLTKMLSPEEPKLFTAVSFCISQLAVIESSAKVLIKCGVIGIVLGLIKSAPGEARGCLWGLLVNLSQQRQFFNDLMEEVDRLIICIKEEVNISNGETESVAQISYNLALRKDFASHLDKILSDTFTDTLKSIFTTTTGEIRLISLKCLANFTSNSPTSRSLVLGNPPDIIDLFEEAGLEDIESNIYYAAILNIISNEENCCIRLIESGAHKILTSLFVTISPSQIDNENDSQTVLKSKKSVKQPTTQQSIVSNIDLKTSEMGRSLIAATFHNLSLKRASIGPGVINCLFSLIKNCKTIRVLHTMRCLANISTHNKAKVVLSKERRLIPLLTTTMRCGCEEADRVQHYGAYVICNVLATNFDSLIMDELVKNDAIVDLVVVSRLRVNAVITKESLAKALFNLISRVQFRPVMVNKLDVLAALIELAKLDSLELLELSTRAVFNISCETSTYFEILSVLKVPALVVSRASSSPNALGSKPTKEVKFLSGMAMANMSFNTQLAFDFTNEKVADACLAVISLNSEEATFCAVITIFNLSLIENCVNLVGSVAIPILVDILTKGPLLCTQLAVAALVNLSVLDAFHEQLTEVSLAPMIQLMNLPQLSIAIKIDILTFLYNLNVLYEPARSHCIKKECISALWKLLKSQDRETVLLTIGRITKEMCSVTSDDELNKKLVGDGVMDVILKLAKKEIPALKVDMACSIYSLTWGGDSMKVLKWDGIDVLFWLTLYDCLGIFDVIRKNVSRTLRNFSARAEECRVLVKEERFMTILKALAKSTNEDVLWQTAGIIYNIMSVEECKIVMVERGIVPLIFEIAGSNFLEVRHVCSASLHMISTNIPDMEDPAVLALVLCLLDADGDRFSELGEKSFNSLPYPLPTQPTPSQFEYAKTEFVANWQSITCTVDNFFTPSLIPMTLGESLSVAVKAFGTSGFNFMELHSKMDLIDAEVTRDQVDDNGLSLSNSFIPPPNAIQPPIGSIHMGGAYGYDSTVNSTSERGFISPMTGDLARLGTQSHDYKVELESINQQSLKLPKLKLSLPVDTLSAIKSSSQQQTQKGLTTSSSTSKIPTSSEIALKAKRDNIKKSINKEMVSINKHGNKAL